MTDDPVPTATVRGELPPFEGAASTALPLDVTVIPTYRLYSRGQVAGATFLGTPLAGAWLLALNYKRLREADKARIALLLGIVATAILLAIGVAMSQLSSRSISGLGIVPVVAMSGIARSLQGAAYESHILRGGKRASSWHVVGLGIACLVICFAAVFGIAMGYASLTERSRVAFGDSEVLYADDGTEAEARAVGNVLVELGYFTPLSKVSVEVRRDHGRHVVAFVVQDRSFSDETLRATVALITTKLSNEAFAGEPLDIWLVDGELEPRVKLLWELRPDKDDHGSDASAPAPSE